MIVPTSRCVCLDRSDLLLLLPISSRCKSDGWPERAEELMLALITDRRSRLRRSGVIRHGLQRSNVDPMPSGADTNGHATASLTYAALVKDAYSQVPRGITKTRNSSVPPPTLPTEGKHSPSHRPRIPSMDNSSERALAR